MSYIVRGVKSLPYELGVQKTYYGTRNGEPVYLWKVWSDVYAPREQYAEVGTELEHAQGRASVIVVTSPNPSDIGYVKGGFVSPGEERAQIAAMSPVQQRAAVSRGEAAEAERRTYPGYKPGNLGLVQQTPVTQKKIEEKKENWTAAIVFNPSSPNPPPLYYKEPGRDTYTYPQRYFNTNIYSPSRLDTESITATTPKIIYTSAQQRYITGAVGRETLTSQPTFTTGGYIQPQPTPYFSTLEKARASTDTSGGITFTAVALGASYVGKNVFIGATAAFRPSTYVGLYNLATRPGETIPSIVSQVRREPVGAAAQFAGSFLTYPLVKGGYNIAKTATFRSGELTFYTGATKGATTGKGGFVRETPSITFRSPVAKTTKNIPLLSDKGLIWEAKSSLYLRKPLERGTSNIKLSSATSEVPQFKYTTKSKEFQIEQIGDIESVDALTRRKRAGESFIKTDKGYVSTEEYFKEAQRYVTRYETPYSKYLSEAAKPKKLNTLFEKPKSVTVSFTGESSLTPLEIWEQAEKPIISKADKGEFIEKAEGVTTTIKKDEFKDIFKSNVPVSNPDLPGRYRFKTKAEDIAQTKKWTAKGPTFTEVQTGKQKQIQVEAYSPQIEYKNGVFVEKPTKPTIFYDLTYDTVSPEMLREMGTRTKAISLASKSEFKSLSNVMQKEKFNTGLLSSQASFSKTAFNAAQKQSSIQLSLQQQSQAQLQNQTSIQTQKQISLQGQKQSQAQLQKQAQIQLQAQAQLQILKNVSGFREVPGPKIIETPPPPPPLFMLKKKKFSFGMKDFNAPVPKQPKKYVPTATALFLGIKGKEAKIGETSGLGIRPIKPGKFKI